MSDETKPPESEVPPAEAPDDEPAPKMIEISKAEHGMLVRAAAKLAMMTDAAGRRLLDRRGLERRMRVLADSGPEEWGGELPGMYIVSRCHPRAGQDVLYFRGTIAVRCRYCKRLGARIKVAEAPPPEFTSPEEKKDEAQPAPAT